MLNLAQVQKVLDRRGLSDRFDAKKVMRKIGKGPRSDARWDSAVDRLEQKYGLRLDGLKQIGPNQMGQPCGRGWVGLRGACKRGKKGTENTEAIKASKVELANKIRKKKGMRDPRQELKEKRMKLGLTPLPQQAYSAQKDGPKPLTYEDFEPKFKKLYFEERARQELRGVVAIKSAQLLDRFTEENNMSRKRSENYFERLKKERKILSVIERGNELIQWVE